MITELNPAFFENFQYVKSSTEPKFNRSIIHESINNTDTLLVTIGDSWTWGDSIYNIGTEAGQVIDSPERLVSIYGFHLKQMLGDIDWINMAYPGTANEWIVDVAVHVAELSDKLGYDKIILSVGLTDIVRDYVQKGYTAHEIYDTNLKLEKEYMKRLSVLEQNSKIVLVIGRNFTSTFHENEGIVKNHLPKKWIDIGAEHTGSTYPPSTFTTSADMIYKSKTSYHALEKKWMLDELFPKIKALIDYLDNSPMHHKKATKHPTVELHKLWAEYVYQYIVDNKLL